MPAPLSGRHRGSCLEQIPQRYASGHHLPLTAHGSLAAVQAALSDCRAIRPSKPLKKLESKLSKRVALLLSINTCTLRVQLSGPFSVGRVTHPSSRPPLPRGVPLHHGGSRTIFSCLGHLPPPSYGQFSGFYDPRHVGRFVRLRKPSCGPSAS